ncbi:unnamed protein product [Prunus brigantina]
MGSNDKLIARPTRSTYTKPGRSDVRFCARTKDSC